MKIVLLLFFLAIGTVIYLTPPSEAVIHDAGSYLDTARQMHKEGMVKTFFSFNANFSDRGYALPLAFVMTLFGPDNIIALQLLNYIFWLASACFFHLTLRLSRVKEPHIFTSLYLFSPLFLSFSSKIYSEPFSALGVTLITYSLISIFQRDKGVLTLIIGSFIFFSTKSVFLLILPIILSLLIFWKRYQAAIWYLIVPLLLTPSIIGSMSGGRSTYNLNIQASKLDAGYDSIISCVPYYLSYPLGLKLLPNYQGVCHQNDPQADMPRFSQNPYHLAETKRSRGFTTTDWFESVIKNPFKYLLIMVVSMANIVFIEGVYPTILLKMPLLIMIIFFVYKIVLSLTLWYLALSKKPIIYYLPLIYFFVIVGNFPIEPRYFYPLIPYLYFLAAISFDKFHMRQNS